MAEFDKAGRRIISVVRVLEYRGTDSWVQKVMAASRLPMQGKFLGTKETPLPEDHFINSGLVVWEEFVEEPGGQEPVSRRPIPIPPPSGTVQ